MALIGAHLNAGVILGDGSESVASGIVSLFHHLSLGSRSPPLVFGDTSALNKLTNQVDGMVQADLRSCVKDEMDLLGSRPSY